MVIRHLNVEWHEKRKISQIFCTVGSVVFEQKQIVSMNLFVIILKDVK